MLGLPLHSGQSIFSSKEEEKTFTDAMATRRPQKETVKGANSVQYLQTRQLESSCMKQNIWARRLLNDRFCNAQGYLPSCNLVGHYGCVNAVEFSNKGGELLISGGDDRRILLWNLEKQISANPGKKAGPNALMKGEHNSNIFCLGLDCDNKHIFSGGNDDQVIVHDTASLETVDVFPHEDAVYGLSPCPTDEQVFASAGADGRILIWDLRQSTRDPFILANYNHSFHAVVYHPIEPCFLASANAKEGVALWDVRKPRTCLLRYSSAYTELNAMSVKFNMFGTKILALRRRLPPAIYNVHSPGPVVEFDHSGYYNSCTMKSCCFAGDKDQYILSGSDDFNLFLWKVPEACEEKEKFHISEATLVLSGHRQIVNQVRYNYSKFLIASSGVEKVIKLWSPLKLPGMLDKVDNSRRMFTHQQYFDMMINSNSTLSHDYSHQSTDEDPHMLAFFDSLIQREVERSISSDSDDSDDASPTSMFFDFVTNSDDSESTDSDHREAPPVSDSDSSSDDERTYHTLTNQSGDNDKNVKQKQNSKRNNRSSNLEITPSEQPTTSSVRPGSSRAASKKESSSEDTSSSHSSGDFFIMKLKSKLFQKISKRRKRSKKTQEIPGKSRFKRIKHQEESDRQANLRQRTAFCKLLKERMPASSDSDSDNNSNEVMEDVLRTLANSLNHRTDVARQRGAAMRVKKLQIASESNCPSQRFEIRIREQGEGSTSHVRVPECAERTNNQEQSLNGANHVTNKVKDGERDDQDGEKRKLNNAGQRSSCSDASEMGIASTSQCEPSNDNHFKKVKKSKKKNYRSHNRGSDS